jgi:hypothetical protein
MGIKFSRTIGKHIDDELETLLKVPLNGFVDKSE